MVADEKKTSGERLSLLSSVSTVASWVTVLMNVGIMF